MSVEDAQVVGDDLFIKKTAQFQHCVDTHVGGQDGVEFSCPRSPCTSGGGIRSRGEMESEAEAFLLCTPVEVLREGVPTTHHPLQVSAVASPRSGAGEVELRRSPPRTGTVLASTTAGPGHLSGGSEVAGRGRDAKAMEVLQSPVSTWRVLVSSPTCSGVPAVDVDAEVVKRKVMVFGRIQDGASLGVRSSGRIRAQPNADATQLERATALAQRRDLTEGTNLNPLFTIVFF